MSASSQTDAFAEAWKRSVTHNFKTGAGLDIPHPESPPKVSIFATHELVHADKPFLTWEPELMLWRNQVPDVPKIRQTLIDLIPDDNFEQLFLRRFTSTSTQSQSLKSITKSDWKRQTPSGRTGSTSLKRAVPDSMLSSRKRVATTLLSHGRMLYLTEPKAESFVGPRSSPRKRNGFSDKNARLID